VRLTQGAFSFLPDLSDEQIKKQVDYAISKGFAISIEFTDDPHPRNSYWEMWGLPLFDVKDSAAAMYELASCRKARPNFYVKVSGFDNTLGVESCAMSFIAQRPANEPGFRMERQESQGRFIRYTLTPYATDRPEGDRY
jgi:ribulose-bisphosphate carboxylase small chain